MDKEKQDILSKDLLLEYYMNFSNYSITDKTIIFESRFSTFYEKPIIYIDDKILAALSFLNLEHIQLLKSRLVYSRKLQEIADDNKITRERARQIEYQSIQKFIAKVDQSIIIDITQKLSNQSILFFDYIPIQDKELRLLFCAILSYKKSRKAIFDKKLMALVQNSAFSFAGLLNNIEQYIIRSGETLFSKDSLVDTMQLLFPKVENMEQLIPILEEKKKLRKIDNGQYFFPFLYKPKRPMIEFIFSLYPKGLELHKEINFIANELNKFFPGVFTEKDKKRSIITVAGYSDSILLWAWGRYLHIKYIYPILEKYDFSLVLDYIDEHLNDTQIDLLSCFEVFERELVSMGISNKYALHTCLKLKYPEEYSYQDSPWISKAGTERRELRQTLKNLMIENRNYSLDELTDIMHTNRTRVQQLIDNTNAIIQVGTFQYKKKEFIDFPKELLNHIIQYANTKVQELNFIYIDLIVDEFAKELNKYNQYDIRIMMLELLKKYLGNKEFNVSNTRIIYKDYPLTKDSLNFQIIVEDLLKDKNTISINEIASYFIKRGLSPNKIMGYYHSSKLKRIVRLDRETFTSVNRVGLKQKDIDKINLLLENCLTGEMHINDIIKNYKLPLISRKWNRFVLTDLTDHSKFIFSPSRENPIYISKKEFYV